MRIREVEITVGDVEAGAQFFREVLELPVVGNESTAVVEVGASRLSLVAGIRSPGSHHIAFEVSGSRFSAVCDWLRSRVDTIVVNGSDLVVGPDGWRSTSVYFMGPDDIVLEAITRDDNAALSAEGNFLGISEIGLGVTDVVATCRTVERELGLVRYCIPFPNFEPLGDHTGLVIVVDTDRTWFPTESRRPSRGGITAVLESDASPVHLTLDDGVLAIT